MTQNSFWAGHAGLNALTDEEMLFISLAIKSLSWTGLSLCMLKPTMLYSFIESQAKKQKEQIVPLLCLTTQAVLWKKNPSMWASLKILVKPSLAPTLLYHNQTGFIRRNPWGITSSIVHIDQGANT